MELDPQISVQIRSAASNCQRLRTRLERMDPNDPSFREIERQYLEAERQMVEVSMKVNRGINRPPPT